MALNWEEYPNFKPSEFDHGGPEMAEAFMVKLQRARTLCEHLCLENGIPVIKFRITSGSRSKERNQQVGGKPDSAHLYGRACDIRTASSREAFFIVKALLLAGFSRIGISEGFIHVDDGEYLDEIEKSPAVLWTY